MSGYPIQLSYGGVVSNILLSRNHMEVVIRVYCVIPSNGKTLTQYDLWNIYDKCFEDISIVGREK